MKKIFESLPMPKCGEKSTIGCYDCIGQNDCEFLQALDDKGLSMGTCPKCGGRMLEESITSSNPAAMAVCIEDNCDYKCNQFLSYEDFKTLEVF